MVGRPSVDGQPRPDPATGERDRQPKPVQLWGDGEGEKGKEVAANTFQKMSGKCLPGPRPNQLPMALNNISANWQQHFRTWVVLSFKKDNGGEMVKSLMWCTTKGNCKQGNSFHSEKDHGEGFLDGLDG